MIKKIEDNSLYTQPSFYFTDKNLPVGNFSMVGAEVQVHTDLLSLCSGSVEKTWCVQRSVANYQKDWPLPSLGR
jgi:hypothetical protein